MQAISATFFGRPRSAAKAGDARGHNRRLERAVAVARNRKCHRAVIRQHGLPGVPVAVVGTTPARAFALLVADVFGHLRIQRAFQQALLQMAEDAVLAEQIGRLLVAGQQLIQQFGSYVSHRRSPLR